MAGSYLVAEKTGRKLPAGAVGFPPRLTHGHRPAAYPPVREQVNCMNWHRLGKLALVGIGTFAAIVLGAFVLIRLMAPTVSLARMVAFNAVMFAVTGAVLAVVIWAAKDT